MLSGSHYMVSLINLSSILTARCTLLLRSAEITSVIKIRDRERDENKQTWMEREQREKNSGCVVVVAGQKCCCLLGEEVRRNNAITTRTISVRINIRRGQYRVVTFIVNFL